MSGRIDPETGLPPLPEGCVWVVQPSRGGTSVWVQLVRGRDVLGQKVTSPEPGFIRMAAEDVLLSHDADAQARDKVDAVCGTYPPGRLP